MCLIAYAIGENEEYPFILIANRDEFFKRKTLPLNWWKDHQNILGGRDIEANGTWMAVNTSGKITAVTNYRDLQNIDPDRRSRGELPVNYLLNGDSPDYYLKELHNSTHEYNGYNLLAGTKEGLLHYSNYEEKINHTSSGIHGLSNGLLNTPWPKVEKIKSEFSKAINENLNISDFFDILSDTSLANDEELPDTGVTKEWEKALSAICIRTEEYGTCSSSVILIDKENNLTFAERVYESPYRKEEFNKISFKIE
jgi:uncharacterized protein with NRDE domain